MELTNILSLDKWIQLENKIHRVSGLDANVFNTDGIRITDLKNWANRLCPAIKATDRGQSFICAVAHMNLSIQAKHTRKPVIEECDAGLLKMVVPVFWEDDAIGVVGACGYLLDDGEIDSFMINKTTEIDMGKIENLSNDIPVIDMEKAASLANFIQAEIDSIITDDKHSG